MSAAPALCPVVPGRRGPRALAWRVCAASALLACLGLAPAAADPATWEADWSFILRTGAFDKVREKLTPAAAQELSSSPKHLFAAARAGATYLPQAFARGKKDLLDIPKWFVQAGTPLQTAENPDALVARALAAVSGLVCRCAGAVGSGADLADAQAVADRTREFYERSPASADGTALVDALSWMRAVLRVEGIDPAPVLAAEQALFAQFSARATGPALAMAKAELEFGKATGTSEAGGAKAAIERCLAALKPVVAAAPPPLEASTLSNEALAFAMERKLGVRGDFVMEEKQSADRRIRIGLPIGIGWSVVGGREAAKLTIRKVGPGPTNIYQLEILLYEAQRSYKSPVSEFACLGSDIKGLAADRTEIDAAGCSTVSKKREPKQVSVGRGFAPGFYTEVTGTDQRGDPIIRRAWIVRGKLHPYTYNLFAMDFSGSDGVPPELQAVVDSLAENKPSK